MPIPVAHIVFDILANIGFGYYLFTSQENCGCGGSACGGLKDWAFVVSIILFVYAGFHILIILNNCFNNCLGKVPIIGDILAKISEYWVDIYVISMLVIWCWALFLLVKYSGVLNCDKDLVVAVILFITSYTSTLN